jgi:hypothetical protein
MKRIKHRDLTHYFLEDHRRLPRAYVASCERFFRSIGNPKYYGGGPDTKGQIFKLHGSGAKDQATSSKRQAASPNSNTIK